MDQLLENLETLKQNPRELTGAQQLRFHCVDGVWKIRMDKRQKSGGRTYFSFTAYSPTGHRFFSIPNTIAHLHKTYINDVTRATKTPRLEHAGSERGVLEEESVLPLTDCPEELQPSQKLLPDPMKSFPDHEHNAAVKVSLNKDDIIASAQIDIKLLLKGKKHPSRKVSERIDYKCVKAILLLPHQFPVITHSLIGFAGTFVMQNSIVNVSSTLTQDHICLLEDRENFPPKWVDHVRSLTQMTYQMFVDVYSTDNSHLGSFVCSRWLVTNQSNEYPVLSIESFVVKNKNEGHGGTMLEVSKELCLRGKFTNGSIFAQCLWKPFWSYNMFETREARCLTYQMLFVARHYELDYDCSSRSLDCFKPQNVG